MWWVDLAAMAAPELVAVEVLRVLGQLAPDPDPAVALRSIDRGCTIVLDNAEHLLDSCAAFVSDLCTHTTSPTIVVTSREPLGLRGEQTWRIPERFVASARH